MPIIKYLENFETETSGSFKQYNISDNTSHKPVN